MTTKAPAKDYISKDRVSKDNVSKGSDRHRQAEAEFAKVLENIGVRGFHGTASVAVNVQDGHIQYTRVIVDRMVK